MVAVSLVVGEGSPGGPRRAGVLGRACGVGRGGALGPLGPIGPIGAIALLSLAALLLRPGARR